MIVHGLQKLTLLDYPGKVACTLFTGNCNFSCPFCQNSGLVLHPQEENVIADEDLWAFLDRRKGILDGVCVSGGEPTLQTDLADFLYRLKEMGYLVKIDSNGQKPDVLKKLVGEQLVDYIAMDVKNCKERYGETVGISGFSVDKVSESIAFLLEGNVDYEFRTTVCRELHSRENLRELVEWIAPCRRYYLQQYKESDNVIRPGFTAYSDDEMKEIADELREKLACVTLRGID